MAVNTTPIYYDSVWSSVLQTDDGTLTAGKTQTLYTAGADGAMLEGWYTRNTADVAVVMRLLVNDIEIDRVTFAGTGADPSLAVTRTSEDSAVFPFALNASDVVKIEASGAGSDELMDVAAQGGSY